MSAKRIKKNTLRFKVIRPVYETLAVDNDENIDVDVPLTSSKRVYHLFRFLIAETREHFFTIHLDSKNKILAIDRVSTGSMNANIVHPREVMKSCLLSSAVAIVCVHNHPSGNPDPSSEDYKITEQLNDAANLLGIRFLDHVIIGDGAYVSFADRGLIQSSQSSLTTIIRA